MATLLAQPELGLSGHHSSIPQEPPMFVALRDLRRNGRRFALVALVVGLVAVLSTVLAGLADGLVVDGTSGLRGLPLDHLSFEPHAGSVFSRSTLDDHALKTWQATDGVEASPIGVSFVNAKPVGGGPSLDLALFGVTADSFLVTRADARRSLSGKPGLVLASELRDEGAKIGDRYRIGGSGVTLPVLGFTFAGSYGHVAIAYTSLATWQRTAYGSDARGRFSALALHTTGTVDYAAVDRRAGTETVTKGQSYAGSPGYSAETATMTMIRAFLVVISALVVGAFFTVLTVQRTRQIGLLKAIGASDSWVVRDGVGQMAILVALATFVGTAVGAVVVALLDRTAAPVALVPGSIVISSVVLVVTGILGSLVALRRVTSIEPAIALGAEG
jgi:putative ABC transport system permease protein